MIYKLRYDRSNLNWVNDAEGNLMFLRQQKNYYNQLCKARGCVTLKEVLRSLGANSIPGWTNLYGWNWVIRQDSVDWEVKAPILFHPDAYYELIFDVNRCFDNEPPTIDYTMAIPRRNGKTSYAEAMEYIRETYLENRKENNMGPEKKMGVAAYIIGKNNSEWMKVVIKKVIFNDPATIVFWSDGTKTVVKAGANDIFDPEKGLAMAISKKVLGNNYKAYGRFKKWLPKEYNNAASEK